MTIKQILSILLASTLTITLFACKEKKKAPSAAAGPGGGGGQRVNAPMTVEGFVVRTKTLSENIEVPGTLFPFENTEIRPEISGRIVSLNIPEGRFVKKGTVLVQLFDGDLQAQLQKLEVQLSISQKTAERQKELLKINGISQQEYDLSELQVSNLNADIQLLKVNIEKTRIRAPFDGQIGLRNISMGAYVTPTNVLTTISQVNDLKLQFTVPEKYSENMKKGKQVNFTIEGSPKKYTAAVLANESSIEANTRTLRVLAVVHGDQKQLVPGAFAKVQLQMGKNDEAMIIPTQAVIPQARNKKVIVYRSGKPEFETVTTGIRDSSFVQIVDGIKVGDTVITTGLLAIRPESTIKLTRIQ
jgi:membrane fusion protein (multidrug efflux system)